MGDNEGHENKHIAVFNADGFESFWIGETLDYIKKIAERANWIYFLVVFKIIKAHDFEVGKIVAGCGGSYYPQNDNQPKV